MLMTTQAAPPGKPPCDPAVVERISRDVDQAHVRLRELDSKIDTAVGRVDGLETRIVGIETRQYEQSDTLSQIRSDLLRVTKESSETLHAVRTTQKIAEGMTFALDLHVRAENLEYVEQTKRIEGVARRLVYLTSAITGLLIVLSALYAHLTDSPIMDFIPHLLGTFTQ